MTDFSLFETMRYTPGEGIARLSLHLKRLETSARRLGFEGAEKAGDAIADYLGVPPSALPGISPAGGEIEGGGCLLPSPPLWGRWRQPEGDFIANAEQALRKTPPQPSPQGGGRAAAVPTPISPLAGEMPGRAEGVEPQTLRLRLELCPTGSIAITSAPFTLQPDDTVWRIAIAQTRTASIDPLIRHKTTRRALYEAARAEFPAEEINEVILLNEKGELAEGTITNLFVEDGEGRLMTPPISSGCLAGVLRTSLICARKAYNHRLRPEDLAGRPVYVGNSLRGLIRSELIER